MTDDGLHPTEGARFLLERQTETNDGARYAGAVFTPDQRWDYQASLRFGGEAELAPSGEPAPGDLERKLLTIARVLARDAAKNREAGLPAWPHRVLRWRGPK